MKLLTIFRRRQQRKQTSRGPKPISAAVLLFLMTHATGCKHDEVANIEKNDKLVSAESTSTKTLNFAPNHGINRFAMVSRPPGAQNASKFNVCFHDLANSSVKEKFNLGRNLSYAVSRWWDSVDSKHFPAGYVRRTLRDLNGEWATVPSGAAGHSCNTRTKWDLHIYLVNKVIMPEGENPKLLGMFTDSASRVFPGTSGPAIFIIPSALMQMTMIHEFGHFLGLDDTYQVPTVTRPDGYGLCKFRTNANGTVMSQERQPDSVMCDSDDLSPHDYEAANCMYCATWPGGMMPPQHPCKETLKLKVCDDLAL